MEIIVSVRSGFAGRCRLLIGLWIAFSGLSILILHLLLADRAVAAAVLLPGIICIGAATFLGGALAVGCHNAQGRQSRTTGKKGTHIG
ncbi:hypothetical protein [Sphingobium bisphenolivorans]|uniref:hypothetical protein n=1 Tax=Sphingobium bisphenolivorans TaxID=1335760 RepID=UPI0003A31213|nr:hypothetical protein [Sphingobium bisphenolivorans]